MQKITRLQEKLVQMEKQEVDERVDKDKKNKVDKKKDKKKDKNEGW